MAYFKSSPRRLLVFITECPGTDTELSVPRGDDRDRYEQYRRKYTNCTLIQGNLEIVFIELTDAQYDFDFLKTILEVNGYVLIYGNYVDRIRLNGLRVIRGRKLFSATENGIQRDFGLYVSSNAKTGDDSVGLKELQLTSLVGKLPYISKTCVSTTPCFGFNCKEKGLIMTI